MKFNFSVFMTIWCVFFASNCLLSLAIGSGFWAVQLACFIILVICGHIHGFAARQSFHDFFLIAKGKIKDFLDN